MKKITEHRVVLRILYNLIQAKELAGHFPRDVLLLAESLLREEDMITERPLWERNGVQFPRLLVETYAVLSADQVRDIASAMDLPRHRVEELFARAEKVWEKRKERGG